ncbi:hypothetical protein [Hugenholtzia roseola]|uniref:hypothetical protein n=1 Tax=Hugenholtzia roseola TaxID=1002 RepID=UPI0003F7ADE8|nr:hypothetical protein [Hugenholtzia roseola]
MKQTNLFRLFAFLAFLFLALPLSAQETKEEYKKRKERPLNIAGANVYTPDETENLAKYRLKEGVAEDFQAFFKTLKPIKTPFHAPEKVNAASFRPVTAAEYQKYFHIIDKRDQSIMEAPAGNKKLYLVGTLPVENEEIFALIFYGIDGNVFQYTKLITFDKEGNPIDAQNVQYYIYGKTGGFEQLDQMYCHVNKDLTFDCYTTSTSKDFNNLNADKKPKENKNQQGFIYEIQPDGTIERVGELDLSEEGKKMRREEMK